MSLEKLECKLVAAARQHKPSEAVPYAFEKRVMRYLRSHPALDNVALWARALWRSAGACATVVLLLSLFSFAAPSQTENERPVDLSQAFERTLLAAVDLEPDLSR